MSNPEPTDGALVERMRALEDDAWTEAYRLFHPRVLSLVRRMVQNEDEEIVSQIAHAVWLRVARNFSRYGGREGDLATWIFSIARTEVLERRRSVHEKTQKAVRSPRTSYVTSAQPGGSSAAGGTKSLPDTSPRSEALAGTSTESIIQMGYYFEARRAFRSDEALAQACSVEHSHAASWHRGESTDPWKLRILRDLAIVVSRLLEYYEPDAVLDWLYGNSPDLGGRQPLELVREGHLTEVLVVIEAQTSGAYV